jgi:hypothetical protein
MFMISKETMNSVMSLREKMGDPKKRTECIAEVENMVKMKESHLARAEWGSCCGNIRNLAQQASSLLEDYIALLQKNYTPEPEHW